MSICSNTWRAPGFDAPRMLAHATQ